MAELLIEQRLAAFLRRAAARQFALGCFDCGLLIADWCLEVCGVDPGHRMRGRYDSVETAKAAAGRTSLAALFNAELRAIGIKLTREPLFGDAAMIISRDGNLRGALVTSGYVLIDEDGISRVAFSEARRVCAWSVISR
jgi:hypothetical protein